MTYWLLIESEPPVALYREVSAIPHISCDVKYPALISLGTLRRPLSLPNFSVEQTANMSVSLDNANGALSSEFQTPPLLALAHVMEDSTPIFSGVITSVDMSASATFNIEAGAKLPLSGRVPLRSNSEWGTYADPELLPHGYGVCTLSPIQYSQDRMVWFLLDHPIKTVVKVLRDNIETSAWAWQNAVDATGHPVSLVELAEPLADGESLSVTVLGKMHPQTGNPLVRPDEILWDVLGGICGLDLQLTDLDAFRTEVEGVVLAGVLATDGRSVRSQIDTILGSVGAGWSAALRGIAIAWPPSNPDQDPDENIGVINSVSVTPVSSLDSLATVVRVLYDYDWAAGTHKQALQLEAPEAIAKWGRIEREIDAAWLHTPRQADKLGRRILSWTARPSWKLSWGGDFSRTLHPGDWVSISHPTSPITGQHRLVQADLDLSNGRGSYSIEAPAGPSPLISAAKLSSAFTPLVQSGAAVTYLDGVATFTLQSDDGTPVAGATVTLDGGAKRISDSSGRVQFSTGRGTHTLIIEAEGYNGMQIEVTL